MSTEMARPRMGQIRVADIRLEGEGWDAYLVRYRASAARIEESVRRSGVILPVMVEDGVCVSGGSDIHSLYGVFDLMHPVAPFDF